MAAELTARPPHSRSREEALAAFEAAVISNLGLKVPQRSRKHRDKFGQLLTGDGNWFMVAKRASPNRGTVTVETLDGKEKEIPIMFGKRYLEVKWHGVEGYLVSDRFPELRQLQKDLHVPEDKTPLNPWKLPLKKDRLYEILKLSDVHIRLLESQVKTWLWDHANCSNEKMSLWYVATFIHKDELRMKLLDYMFGDGSTP